MREAAAIAEVSPEIIRTALEKKAIEGVSKRRAGKVFRYGFSVKDVLLMKLLADFPFPLSRSDKAALRKIVAHKSNNCASWRTKGPDFVFTSGDLTVVLECKSIRTRIAKNVSAFRWEKAHYFNA